MSENPDAVVVGIDFGTLSGRAVVVRVRDGAELGSAVHAYGNAVVERALPATGETLPPDWALKMPPVDRIAGTRPIPGGRKGLLT
jgi:L-ribulokinase